jgi:PKD repeat protein
MLFVAALAFSGGAYAAPTGALAPHAGSSSSPASNSSLNVGISTTGTSGVVPYTTQFTASASGGTGSYTFSWSFGDGASGSGAQISHTYATAGTFTAIVTVTDSSGNTAQALATITVTPTSSLSVTLTSSQDPTPAGTSIHFIASASGGVAPYAFAWTFGDGSYGSNNSSWQGHVYSSAGLFVVTVYADDSGGLTGSATLYENVTPVVIVSLAVSPDPVNLGGAVTYSATVSGGTAPYAYSWNGLPPGCSPLSGASLYCTPTAAGTYSSTIVVTDAAGIVASASATLSVIGNGTGSLSVTLSVNPSMGPAPLATMLVASVTGGSAPFVYSWNFGDGSSGTGGSGNSSSVGHTYVAAGTYKAQVTVTDASGSTASATTLITALASNSTLQVTASASPASGPAPLTVTFSAAATGGTVPYLFFWTFSNGATSNSSMAVMTFSTTGVYTGTVTVTDAVGATASASVAVKVNQNGTGGNPLVVSVSASPSAGYAPLTTALSAQASGGYAPYFYSWNFGDGSNFSGTGSSVAHTYGSAGTYDAVATVTDSAGQVATGSAWISVWSPGNGTGNGTGPQLELSVSGSPVMGPAPLTSTLTASATGGTSPYNFVWNFGDGSSGSGASVAHTYAQGSYIASVVCTDANGDQAYSSILITATGQGSNQTPAFTLLVSSSGITGKLPYTATFFPSVVGGTAPYTLSWNFGDGSALVVEHGTAEIQHTYTSTGKFSVSVQASDSAGHKATWSSAAQGVPSVDIIPAKTGGGGLPGGSVLEIVLVAAIGIVVVLLAVAAMQRRMRGVLPPTRDTMAPSPLGMAPYDRYSTLEPPAPPPSPVLPGVGQVLPPASPPASGNGTTNGNGAPRDTLGDMV